MKRLFLVLLSFATLTACSSGAVSQEEPEKEMPEETTAEQGETPEETVNYFTVDTDAVSFELEDGVWELESNYSAADLPAGMLSSVIYFSNINTGNVNVLCREKTSLCEKLALGQDADIKTIADAQKENAEASGTEYTEYAETEISGHKGVLSASKSVESDGTVYCDRNFIFIWNDTNVVYISCETIGEEDYAACEKDFEHIFDTLTIH